MEQKYESQLQEIQKNRLAKEKKIKERHSLLHREHESITKQFLPRIHKVCREFALATGTYYSEGYSDFSPIPYTEDFYESSGCQIAETSRSYNCIGVGLITLCGINNKLRSSVYIQPLGDYFHRVYEGVNYIPINRFNEELLVTKLRKIMKV